ncbi:MAG: hypothetical protein ABIY63_13230 [Fibrobacteria bacterium]
MSAEKVYINAGPTGSLSIGNQVITLSDDSRKEFKTDNLLAFESFVKGREGEAEIYYSAQQVSLVPTKADKNFKALAVCILQDSQPLAALSRNVNTELGILDFEKLLTKLRKYAVGSHLTVLSNLRAFSVAKKQTYERIVDNGGNFKMLIQRESAQGDWTPPAKLGFKVPIFTYLEETVEVEFDLIFTITDAGAPEFRLENLMFAEELLERRVEVLDARLGAVATCPKYWGMYVNHPQDDSWKFRENKASL